MTKEISKSEETIAMTALRVWYGSLILQRTEDDEVKNRMQKALLEVRKSISEEDEIKTEEDLIEIAKKQIISNSSDAQRIAILVELRTLNPFAPHVIKFSEESCLKALDAISTLSSAPLDDVKVLDRYLKEAVKAFAPRTTGLWIRRATGAALVAAVGTFVVATGGAAAPVMTGLLALLGGGSIASGGLGMVGGVIVLVVSTATGSALITMSGKILTQLGPDGLREELIKLEVTQRLCWREGLPDVPKRSEIARQQKKLRNNIKDLWMKEEKISDPKSEPIQSWQKMHELVEKSIARFESLP